MTTAPPAADATSHSSGFPTDWKSFSPALAPGLACAPWRAYCDQLHQTLLTHWAGQHRHQRALKTDLFDEAVGEGCIGSMLRIARHVHGIDISAAVVSRAQHGHPTLRAAAGDVRYMPYRSRSFDLVVSNSTLDHFESTEEVTGALQEIARVLHDEGRLIVTLDNPSNPLLWIRARLPQRILHRMHVTPYFMGKTLSRPRLTEALLRAGLQVQASGYIQHVPRIVAVGLCRALQRHEVMAAWLPTFLLRMERLSQWWSAPITGNYVAVLATRTPGPRR